MRAHGFGTVLGLVLCLASWGCSGGETGRRCDEGQACLPGEVCSAGGQCTVVSATDGGMSIDAGSDDAGPGGPPYAIEAQGQHPGSHAGATPRYHLRGRLDFSAGQVGATPRHRLVGGIVGRGER